MKPDFILPRSNDAVIKLSIKILMKRIGRTSLNELDFLLLLLSIHDASRTVALVARLKTPPFLFSKRLVLNRNYAKTDGL